MDDLIVEISQYLTGEVRLPAPERQIAVILFTDLVGSTYRAESAGDAAWKRLLDRHDEVNRTAVNRRGGEVIKTTGDGVLALLPSATAAIEAAQTIRTQLRDEDLEVRIGIHLGEIDRRGNDMSRASPSTSPHGSWRARNPARSSPRRSWPKPPTPLRSRHSAQAH